MVSENKNLVLGDILVFEGKTELCFCQKTDFSLFKNLYLFFP